MADGRRFLFADHTSMSTTTQQPETQIEIGANAVALFKLPMPVKQLAGIIEQLDAAHGGELHMIEQPKGWLQFFKP